MILRMAIWTSGEPVSPSWTAFSEMTWVLTSLVIMVKNSFQISAIPCIRAVGRKGHRIGGMTP